MPTNPGDLGDQIGVVGCSNTRDAVEGYLAASTMDRLINTAQGGNAMSQWAETSGGPWVQYQAMRPVNGYSAVWLNLCQRAVAGLDQSLVDTVIANIRTRDAGATIIISPQFV